MPKRSDPTQAGPPKPKLALRTCRYCRCKFRPTRDTMHFCQEAHRKLFWAHGALPFAKLLLRIRRETQSAIDKQLAQIVKPLKLAIGELQTRVIVIDRERELRPPLTPFDPTPEATRPAPR